MRFLRLLLFPLSFIYALGVILRNWAYDAGIFRSRKFKIPVISVGNLAVGGSGKSPMTEYLVTLFKNDFTMATLSRGYGRRTKGFLNVKLSSLAEDVGDEPLQFKQKFPEITVAVCEDRVAGIKELNQRHELIIMDDAYQHRAVKPGFSILLFDYNSLFNFPWFLPSGDLREPLSGRKRADVIVVTKTPGNLPDEERLRIIARVDPYPHQQVYFSYLDYGDLAMLYHPENKMSLAGITAETQIVLLTGIANPAPLAAELKRQSGRLVHHQYPDHYQFGKKNISKLVAAFKALPGSDKLIITTEKDAQRLKGYPFKELLKGLPVYYLPVKAAIHQPDENRFNDLIREYVRQHTVNNRVHKA